MSSWYDRLVVGVLQAAVGSLLALLVAWQVLGRVDVGPLSEADEAEGQVEQAEVGRFELLVPGGDPAELLELAEQPLDPVPLPVPGRVPGPAVRVPVGLQRDVRVDVPVDAVAPQLVPVERLVPDQLV